MSAYDAVILGGGPAGCATAGWLARRGLRPLLIERDDALGGMQRRSPYGNAWLVSSGDVPNGHLPRQLALGVAESGAEVLTGASVEPLARRDGLHNVHVRSGNGDRLVAATFLVIATGTRQRDGGLVATPRLLIGQSHAAAALDVRGLRVGVVGGGDTALETREEVLRRGARRAVVHARALRAGRLFRPGLPAEDWRPGPCAVDEARLSVDGQSYDALFVMLGFEPVVPSGLSLARRPGGHLRTDVRARASAPGVYAVGDVAGRMHPCVATAIADGVTAAKDVEARLDRVIARRLAPLRLSSSPSAPL